MTVPVCALRSFSVLLETLTWRQPCSSVRWWASDSWDRCLKSVCSAVWMCYKIAGEGGGGSWAVSYHWNLMPGVWMNEQLGGGGGLVRWKNSLLGTGENRHVEVSFYGEVVVFHGRGGCMKHGRTLLVVSTGCNCCALCIHEIAISPPTLVLAGVTCLRFQLLLTRMIDTHFSRALLTSVRSGRGRSAAKTVLHAGCDS